MLELPQSPPLAPCRVTIGQDTPWIWPLIPKDEPCQYVLLYAFAVSLYDLRTHAVTLSNEEKAQDRQHPKSDIEEPSYVRDTLEFERAVSSWVGEWLKYYFDWLGDLSLGARRRGGVVGIFRFGNPDLDSRFITQAGDTQCDEANVVLQYAMVLAK